MNIAEKFGRWYVVVFCALAGVGAASIFAVMTAFSASTPEQTRARTPTAFEFEVATIKPSAPDKISGFVPLPGPGIVTDTFSAKNVTTIMLIRSAFGIPPGAEDSRIAEAPDWLSSERYDVEAKVDSFVVRQLKALDIDHRKLVQQHMLQMLLLDRFKLATHKETRDLPFYSLVVADNGPKLQEPKAYYPAQGSASGPRSHGATGIGMTGNGGPIIGESVAVGELARVLSILLGHPVLDKTGLTGTYDFTLQWTPDENQKGRYINASGPTVPAMFTALQEQLGLKLEVGKAPMEVIVIDRVERPSGN